MSNRPRLRWLWMMAAGLLFGAFAASEFAARATIAVDGIVISSELKCEEPRHNRCVRTYLLRSVNSGRLFTYAAGPNDESLPQSIPDGARVLKRKGELSYTIDGHTVLGFPIWWYSGMILLGIAMFVAGLIGGYRWWLAFRRSLDEPDDEGITT